MGNSQSQTSYKTAEKAMVDRLGAMQLQTKAQPEEDHVSEKASSRVIRKPEGLSVAVVEGWQDSLLEDPKNRLALAALSNNDPLAVLTSRRAGIADQQVFNVKIPFEGAPITNQRQSGRCWLFASTNVFRLGIMRKYKLDSFELSQAYLFFWDKLEKANWFLEQIIDTADRPLDDRMVQSMLNMPVSDGGQWDMVYNLVSKYGLVPQVLYPDSTNAKNSSIVNKVVLNKLREYALTLRRLASASRTGTEGETLAATLSRTKERMMREIHTVLVVSLGPPPAADAEFAWTFDDRSGKTQTVRVTPRDFAADIYSAEYRVTSETVAGMTSLVHDPRNEALTLLTVDRLGNVVGGRGITYVNVDMAAMKRACVAQLRAGMPVFFGSDVGQFSNKTSGIMDLDLYQYELGFGVGLLGSSKADRLRTGESAMTHAMVLTAVHVDEDTGKTVRWRVQNSWGEDVGEKGWFVMTDAWMDQFVFQAVIDPRFLTKEEKAVLKQDPVVLPLWDPMGALA